MVTNATEEDISPWFELARQVEPLFGPMANEPDFLQHLRHAIADGRAYCMPDVTSPTSGRLAGGILTDKSCTKVAWLAVDEACRGQGIGKALLGHLLDSADRPRLWTVQTFAEGVRGGTAARGLYTSFGFKPIRSAGINPVGLPTETLALCRGSWWPTDSPLVRHPASDHEREWLYKLKRETMGPYVQETWGWDDVKQREIFTRNFDPLRVQILRVAGIDVGCISSYRNNGWWWISQLFISSTHQRQGIGTAVLVDEIAFARAHGLTPALRVLKVNPAQRLYQRLWFDKVRETETHIYMEIKDEGRQ